MSAKFKVGDRIIYMGSRATIVGIREANTLLWSGLPYLTYRYAIEFDNDRSILDNVPDTGFYYTGENINDPV